MNKDPNYPCLYEVMVSKVWPSTEFVAVFSQESYEMVINEHIQMRRRDCVGDFPEYIHALKDGKLVSVGMSIKNYNKMCEGWTWTQESKEEGLNKFKEYNKTHNIRKINIKLKLN